MVILVIGNSMTRNDLFLCVYTPWASSIQLTLFMLDVDVARRVLLGISAPPFQTDGADFSRAKDDTILKR